MGTAGRLAAVTTHPSSLLMATTGTPMARIPELAATRDSAAVRKLMALDVISETSVRS
jgi:hypothetical protein